jgi:cupin 2 domain-containing protein
MTNGFARGRLGEPGSAPATGELAERVFARDGVAIEHILSGELERPVAYRQAEHEWVALLSGSARLRIAGEDVSLTAGEWLFLPAGLEHELVETTPGARWLAVFFQPTGERQHR